MRTVSAKIKSINTIHTTDENSRQDTPVIEFVMELNDGKDITELKFTEMLSNLARKTDAEVDEFIQQLVTAYVGSSYLGLDEVEPETGNWDKVPALLNKTYVMNYYTPAKLVFTNIPKTAVIVNEPITDLITVEVQDADGNRVVDYFGSVILSIKIDTGSKDAALLGAYEMPAEAGIATFHGIGISLTGKGYILQATRGNLIPAESGLIDVVEKEIIKEQ